MWIEVYSWEIYKIKVRRFRKLWFRLNVQPTQYSNMHIQLEVKKETAKELYEQLKKYFE